MWLKIRVKKPKGAHSKDRIDSQNALPWFLRILFLGKECSQRQGKPGTGCSILRPEKVLPQA
jgi:hypothetical protein